MNCTSSTVTTKLVQYSIATFSKRVGIFMQESVSFSRELQLARIVIDLVVPDFVGGGFKKVLIFKCKAVLNKGKYAK